MVTSIQGRCGPSLPCLRGAGPLCVLGRVRIPLSFFPPCAPPPPVGAFPALAAVPLPASALHVDVYNFEVAHLHTYFAGGILVHNNSDALFNRWYPALSLARSLALVRRVDQFNTYVEVCWGVKMLS
jgi:hypothetical protein